MNYNHYLKKIFDTILALVLIIVFLPICLIVSMFIWQKMGNPILFRQKRPGLDGEIFGTE